MKLIGKRKARPISEKASGELLKQGAIFNDEIHRLPTGSTTCFPRGIYRYATSKEANDHWDSCVIERIVRNGRQ